MYKFAHKRIVKWPIAVGVVDAEGGGITEVPISLQFELLTRLELAEIFGADEAQVPSGVSDMISVVSSLIGRLKGHPKDRERLLAKVKGWEGVVDANTSDPIPFSREALADAIDTDMRFYEACVRGLIQASAGGAARKN